MWHKDRVWAWESDLLGSITLCPLLVVWPRASWPISLSLCCLIFKVEVPQLMGGVRFGCSHVWVAAAQGRITVSTQVVARRRWDAAWRQAVRVICKLWNIIKMQWEWHVNCLPSQCRSPEALACCSLLGKYLKVVAWYPGSETESLWGSAGGQRAEGSLYTDLKRTAVWTDLESGRSWGD